MANDKAKGPNYTDPNNHPHADAMADIAQAEGQRHYAFGEMTQGNATISKGKFKLKLNTAQRPAGMTADDPPKCGDCTVDFTRGADARHVGLQAFIWPAGSHKGDNPIPPALLDDPAAVTDCKRARKVGPVMQLVSERATRKETQGGGEALEYSLRLEASVSASDPAADGLTAFLIGHGRHVMSLHPAQLELAVDAEPTAKGKGKRKAGKLTIHKANVQADAFKDDDKPAEDAAPTGDVADRAAATLSVVDTAAADRVVAEADAEAAKAQAPSLAAELNAVHNAPTAKGKARKSKAKSKAAIAPPGSATK